MYKKLPYNQKIGMIKMASGHMAVAHKLKQWNLKNDDLCPFCNNKETVDHIFQCQEPCAKDFRNKQMNLFITHLKSRQTDPSIISSIKNI